MTVFQNWLVSLAEQGGADGGLSARTYAAREADTVKINEFYPSTSTNGGHATTNHTAIPTGTRGLTTDPLSNYYSSLANAQADYPFATALTNETDWCAIMAAILYVYNRKISFGAATNNNATTIVANGIYYIHTTITINLDAFRLVGQVTVSNPQFTEATSFNFTSAAPVGTKTAMVWMLDIWTLETYTNVFATQPGSSHASTNTNGPICEIRDIAFLNYYTGTPMTGPPSGTSYRNAIRLRFGGPYRIYNCSFGGAFYDGITITGASLYLLFDQNWFYGVYRDCISQYQLNTANGNFSTTTWIKRNAFADFNRYAIFLGNMNATGATPVIEDNVFEGANYTSYFWQNPQWWVQGAVGCQAGALIGCAQLSWKTGNYNELEPAIAQIHAVSCASSKIENLSGNGTSWSVLTSVTAAGGTITGATIVAGVITAGTPSGTIKVGEGVINRVAASATFSGTTMTVTSGGAGLTVGQAVAAKYLTGSQLPANTKITGGSAPNWTLNNNCGTIGAAIQVYADGIVPGSYIASGNGIGTWTLNDTSVNLSASTTIAISGNYSPAMYQALFTQGWADVNDTSNYLCGKSGDLSPAVSNMQFIGDGSLNTAGGSVFSKAALNIINMVFGFTLDFDVGTGANGFNVLNIASCSAGSVATVNGQGILTVDATTQGTWAAGQTVWSPFATAIPQYPVFGSYGAASSPIIVEQLTGGAGGAGTYLLSQPYTESAKVIYGCLTTAATLDSLGNFSGDGNSINGQTSLQTNLTNTGQIFSCGTPFSNGGYNNGTYTTVPLTNVVGSGSGATATIVVSGNNVTSVTPDQVVAATGYKQGDVLTCAAGFDGGAQTGWNVQIRIIGNPIQQRISYGRWANVLEAYQDVDVPTPLPTIELFDLLFLRSGAPGHGWNGYQGIQINTAFENMLIANQTLLTDTPLFHSYTLDQTGTLKQYTELSGVATNRKIRYNYSAAPVGANDPTTNLAWAIGDIVYNNAPASGGYIGWVNTAGGWKTFGLIS